jgi:hypothetical protein
MSNSSLNTTKDAPPPSRKAAIVQGVNKHLPLISSVAWTENRPVIVINCGTRFVLGRLVQNGDERTDAAAVAKCWELT